MLFSRMVHVVCNLLYAFVGFGLDISTMLITCVHHAHKLHKTKAESTHKMHMSRMFVQCYAQLWVCSVIEGTCAKSKRRIQDARKSNNEGNMYKLCMHDAYRMRTECIHNAYRMHTPCKPCMDLSRIFVQGCACNM